MKVNVDRMGAFASAVCAVHCVLTGVAMSLLPVVGLQFLATPAAEFTFIALAIVLGLTAIVHGIRRHGDYRPSLVFLFGLISLVLSHFVFGHRHVETHGDHVHIHAGSPWATVTAVLAGLSFVAFHVINARLHSSCGCGSCHAPEPANENA